MPHVLPPDWQDVVRRVSGWLDDACVKLDRHETEFQTKFALPAAPPTLDADALVARLRELPKKLEPLEATAAAADSIANEADEPLRDLARRSQTLRLRLAEGIGRAI